MDRKSKIWLIVLLALLIAAIAAIIVFNGKLNNSSRTLSTALEQLATEQSNVADLKDALDKAQADYDEVSAKMTADAEAPAGERE